MTEKQIKLPNKKVKHVKAKKELAKKVVSSDSEFSDSNEMETSEKDIKKISADVSQMLANLKKEHGLEEDDGPSKKKKKPNDNKVNAKAEQVKQPKLKQDAKNAAQKNQQQQQQKQQQQEKPGNQKQKKKKEPKKQLASNEQKEVVQQKQPEILKKENKKGPKNGQVKNDKQKMVKPANEEQSTDAQAAGKKKKNKKAKKPKEPQNLEETANENVKVEEQPEDKISATKQSPKKKKSKKNGKSNLQFDVETSAMDVSENQKTADEKTVEQKKDYYLKDASPICVTNLPINIKRKQVLKAFKKFGKVLAIRFRTNMGKSFLNKAQLKGVPFIIAFIYFDTLEAAKASLVMNNEIFHDNKISVDLDSQDITNKVQPKSTILVGNLKYAVTQALLHETFECCGKIGHIRVIQTKQGCKGVAFIRFENPDSVALALELDKTPLLDRPMHVERYKEAKLKKTDKIKLQSVKKLKVKAKNPGAVNKPPTTNNNPIQGKSPNKKQKSPKEGKKKNKEFQGVKSNDAKKAHLTKNKKKKLKMHHEKRMALKIAPKENKQDNAD